MKYIIRLFRNLFCNILTVIVNIFIRRDSNTILVGAWMGSKFADNSRYLFQYLTSHKDELNLKHVVWVTRNKDIYKELSSMGYETYMMHSLGSYFYHFKAGMHIVCNMYAKTGKCEGDIMGNFSLGSRRIQLWHGIPIKSGGKACKEYQLHHAGSTLKQKIIDFQNKSKFYRHILYAPGGWDQCTFISTGKECTSRCSLWTGFPNDYFIECGYARHCECLAYLNKEKEVLNILKNYKQIIFYLPTFRSYPSRYVHPLECKELIAYLEKNDCLWIEKPHAVAHYERRTFDIKNKYILTLKQEFDLNTILPYVNLLITDYSSVSLDALYFNKRILYYIPDFEEYKEYDRGFLVSFDENTAGIVVYDENNLVEALNKALSDHYFTKEMKQKYETLKLQLYDDDNTSYQKITNSILKRCL